MSKPHTSPKYDSESSLKLVEDKKIGSLELFILSDDIVALKLDFTSKCQIFQLEDIQIHNEKKLEFIIKSCIVLKSLYQIDFDQFREAIDISLNMQRGYLNLHCFVKDIFFASCIDTDVTKYEKSFTRIIPDIEKMTKGKIPARRQSTESKKTIIDVPVVGHRKCVYCERNEADVSYVYESHPLIPFSYDFEPLYMCNPCSQTWKLYRESAISHRVLILPNELNEELCGLCSASPSKLVMCSKCPRSYCHPCLVRTIHNPKYLCDMETNYNWTCMNCTQYHHLNVHKLKYDQIEESKETSSSTTQRISSSSSSASQDIVTKGSMQNGVSVKFTQKKADINSNSITQSSSSKSNNRLSISPGPQKKRGRPKINVSGVAMSSASPPLSTPLSTGTNNNIVHSDINPENSVIDSQLNGNTNIVHSVPDSITHTASIDSSINNATQPLAAKRKRVMNKNYIYDIDYAVDMLSHPILMIPNTRVTSNNPLVSRKKVNSPSVVNGTNKKKDSSVVASSQPATTSQNNKKEIKRKTDPKSKPDTSIATSTNQISVSNKVGSNIRAKQLSKKLPPVDKTHDETYYFSQYVAFVDTPLSFGSKNNLSISNFKSYMNKLNTEDFCFLCKDGGELVECDCNRNDVNKHCRKVYHNYCLGFEVHNNSEFKCARHYCAFCGDDSKAKLIYYCKYCPNSFCRDCISEWLKLPASTGKYCIPPSVCPNKSSIVNINNLLEKSKDKATTYIICGPCMSMVAKCQKNDSIDFNFDYGQIITSNVTDTSTI